MPPPPARQQQQAQSNQQQQQQQQPLPNQTQTEHQSTSRTIKRMKKRSRKSRAKSSGSNLNVVSTNQPTVNNSASGAQSNLNTTTTNQRGPASSQVTQAATGQTANTNTDDSSGNESAVSDYKLLLTPMFSAMTKITDHLFLTGVGGMTRENFRKNHIDFVVNITTEAPFWEDVESMRLPLEDDSSTNILPYLDMAVDRINEAIVKRNSHVLVHCLAGVSRSATIVIAYLMKHKRMDLRNAFNFCYALRPVIRPNNSFMHQLMNYELQLFGRSSIMMVNVDVEGTMIIVPQFFVEEHPRLVLLEVMRVREQQKIEAATAAAAAAAAPASPANPTHHNVASNQNNPHVAMSSPFNTSDNKTSNNDN